MSDAKPAVFQIHSTIFNLEGICSIYITVSKPVVYPSTRRLTNSRTLHHLAHCLDHCMEALLSLLLPGVEGAT